MQQMEDLSRQNAALLEEVRDLRRENTQLRRELDQARGRHAHEPYMGRTEPNGTPVAAGSRAAASPGAGDAADTVRPSSPVGRAADILMDHGSPEPVRDAKRAKAEADKAGRHDA